MSVPFVHSNYPRVEGDHYPTIDPRCLQGLLATCPGICGRIVDPCSPRGSAIVDQLRERGYDAVGLDSVADVERAAWIVTNPPYDRRIVDGIVEGALDLVIRGRVYGAAFLMRSNWDFAARRAALFRSTLYRGQIKLRFRPWWSEERKAQPIHNYAWHVWAPGSGEPVIRYWPNGERDEVEHEAADVDR